MPRPASAGRVGSLPAGPGPDHGRSRQEGAQYKGNTLPGSHALQGVELHLSCEHSQVATRSRGFLRTPNGKSSNE
jgi:hypothetical protein